MNRFGAESFTLSLTAMDILWDRLGLGEHVFPFVVPSFGELMADRERLATAVFADLAERGLAVGEEPSAALSKALALLARGETAVVAVASLDGDDQLLARAAVNNRTGIRAVFTNETFYFDHIRPEALVGSVLELLPREVPGPGHSVRFGANAPRPARSEDEEDTGFRWRRTDTGGADDAQRHAATAMFQGPKRRAGYFVAFTRDQHGRSRQATGLGWFDNEQGRYLMRSQEAGDGRQWASMAPADPTRLAQQLQDLVASAR
jgi:hypothetical protein